MAFRETDPLLPRDKPAPEIRGSRPQSISNEYGLENDTTESLADNGSLRWGVNHIIAWCAVLMTFVFVIVTILPEGFKGIWGDHPSTPKTIDERVSNILSNTPLIDGHNDLAIFIRVLYNNRIYGEKFTKPFSEGGMNGHVDLPRLRGGKVGGTFWAAFVPCPANGTDFSDENYAPTVSFTFNQIDVLTRLQAAYPTHFSTPPNSTTALSFFHEKKLISPLAIEGLHQIGNSISTLRNYYALGVRYATLTHNCHNAYADAALVELPSGGIEIAKPHWNGVSPAGRLLIHEMNRMGMIVDLSHVSHDTMLDVLQGDGNWPGSAAPPIFSHSSVYTLCPHPRNVKDDILALVKKRSSIVMVNFSPDFISCVAPSPPNENRMPNFYPDNSTLAHVVDHIVYIGESIGYDYVGLGSDFDGIPTVPQGLEDVSKFPDLVAELLKRRISDEDAAKVAGGNLLRVWAEVDAVAEDMQSKGEKPLEDNLPGIN